MRLSLLALVLTASPAFAQETAGPDCGGDAFSSAQVIEKRPPRHGPLTATPDTLCADVAPQGPPVQVEIGVYPGIAPQVGGDAPGAPYGDRPPRRGGPSRPPHP